MFTTNFRARLPRLKQELLLSSKFALHQSQYPSYSQCIFGTKSLNSRQGKSALLRSVLPRDTPVHPLTPKMPGFSMTGRTLLLSLALFFVASPVAQAVNKTECRPVSGSSCSCVMSDGSGTIDLAPLREMLGSSYA